MSAGAAAAIVGVRLGKEKARRELHVGARRRRIVDEAAIQASKFERLFNAQPPGPAEKRLHAAVKAYGGPRGTPTTEDINFICQAADTDQNGYLDPEEVNFAYRLYCVWADHHKKFEQNFAKYDADCSGSLDRAEFHKFLIELNEGELVKNEEVAWVMERADVSGDGKLQFVELIIAVTVWYCDVPVLHERRPPCLAVLDVLSLIFLSRETRYTQRRQQMKNRPLLRNVKARATSK
jgi:Ca2+-binding EF-hand superfamily protein